jgi:hypothetical protein
MKIRETREIAVSRSARLLFGLYCLVKFPIHFPLVGLLAKQQTKTDSLSGQPLPADFECEQRLDKTNKMMIVADDRPPILGMGREFEGNKIFFGQKQTIS